MSLLKGIKWEEMRNPPFDSIECLVTLKYWGLKDNTWYRDKVFVKGLTMSREFIEDVDPDVVIVTIEESKRSMLLNLFSFLYENPEHYEAFSSDIPFDLSDVPIYTSRIIKMV